jgi:hypothetical protein
MGKATQIISLRSDQMRNRNDDRSKKMKNDRRAAEILIRYSWMKDHPAFQNTDCQIGVIDWNPINNAEWNFNQQILIEVFKFITTEESNVQLDDLLALNPVDRGAALLAIQEKFKTQTLEENIRI